MSERIAQVPAECPWCGADCYKDCQNGSECIIDDVLSLAAEDKAWAIAEIARMEARDE